MQVVDWFKKQTGKIQDNFSSYKFYVSHMPESTPDSSTTLSLTAWADRQKNAIIPATYRWFRIKNQLKSQAYEFKGASFICQPSDVGSILQVEVESVDPEHPGKAILDFGPVKLDVLLKKQIQSALASGCATMHIDLASKDQIKECEFKIFEDAMMIKHCNSDASYKFAYNIGEPIFDVMHRDTTRISIVFNEKYEQQTIKFMLALFGDTDMTQSQRLRNQTKLELRFSSRAAKDEFIFIMKAFNTKRELKTAVVINKIEQLDYSAKENFDYALQIQSLRTDLRKLVEINNKHKQDKLIYHQQNQRLEKQIEEIISSYTKLIEGKFKTREQFEESFIDFQNKKDEALTHKYKRIADENARLKDYIRQIAEGQGKDFPLPDLQEHRMEHHLNQAPFAKKKSPFQALGTQQNQQYVPLLRKLDQSLEEIHQIQPEEAQQLKKQNLELEKKLNRSFQTIEKLQGKVKNMEKLNQSAILLQQDQGSESLNRSRLNNTALEISTGRVVQQKVQLQRKYAKLKEDHLKLKQVAKQLKGSKPTKVEQAQKQKDLQFKQKYINDESLLLSKAGQNPQFSEQANRQIKALKKQIKLLEGQRDLYISQIQQLTNELSHARADKEQAVLKLQRKISEMKEQLDLARRKEDVLNRSQHLSMEMEEYQEEQSKSLKEQNDYLLNQTEKLAKLVEKYKGEAKRLRETAK